jgi:hypothetical protein
VALCSGCQNDSGDQPSPELRVQIFEVLPIPSA